MGEAWYDDLPEDALIHETDKAYESASAAIREGLAKGFDFDTASGAISVPNEELRKNIIEDMLKVLIAEEHFDKNVPLEQLAEKLRVPVERLETAKLAMIEDVKQASIKAFHRTLGRGSA